MADLVPASNLPAAFRNNVIGAFPNGAAWLETLPALIGECASRWRLSIEEPFELSFSYVAPARTAAGWRVVLKIAVPNAELISGIQALQCYDGCGAVRLLDFDCKRGFLLMERLVPGKMLASLEDEERATRIAASVMRTLWRPLPPGCSFPTVAQWADGLKKLRVLSKYSRRSLAWTNIAFSPGALRKQSYRRGGALKIRPMTGEPPSPARKFWRAYWAGLSTRSAGEY